METDNLTGVYSFEDIEVFLLNDEVSDEEAGFMVGYLAA